MPNDTQTGLFPSATPCPNRTPDPLEPFLAGLFRAGIRVSARDGRLVCSGPQTLLTGDIGAQIKARKPEILNFLSQGHPTERNTAIPALGLTAPPLSPAQQRLWTQEQMDPALAHHLFFALEARGTLDANALAAALSQIMSRHATLRMRVTQQDGSPVQTISNATDLPFAVEHSSTLSDAALAQRVRHEAAKPFDLTSEPPLRVSVLARGCADHVLLFTLHHIAADAGSIEILMRELAAFYGEAVAGFRPELPDLPVQYGDVVAWMDRDPGQQAEARRAEAYWDAQLREDLPVTRLPADRPRPAIQDMSSAQVAFEIPADLATRLRHIAAEHGASLFALLIAAFGVLTARQTGQTDIVIGTPMAHRPRPETEALVGMFVNPLPIRFHTPMHDSFGTVLRASQAQILGAQAHQQMPFETLAARYQPLRDPGASPLFQLKVQLDPAARAELDLPGLVLQRLPPPVQPARHDLSLDLVDGKAVSGHLTYATALFDEATILRLAGQLRVLLEAIADDPSCPIGKLPLLTKRERHDLLVTWNDTAMPVPRHLRFAQIFEDHAARTPDAIALEHLGQRPERLSYAELNARANRLAHAIRARGLGPGDVVAIALPRGPMQIAAWLGVLKSGAAYLPLDPSYPADRLRFMLEDSDARLIFCDTALSVRCATPRLELDRGCPDGPETNPVPFTDPNDLAYVIYTSGSTGRPKGVDVPHEGLANLTLDKIRRCEVTPEARIFGFFTFAFDASIPDMVMSLGAGARLVTADADDVLPGPRMAALMRDSGATHLTITPSALAHLPSDALPDLRMVLVGGEAPSSELIQRWSTGRLFINAYGPTECTVNASMVPCGNGHPDDPTLAAPANKQLHVLDDGLGLLPVGCPGELCIGGLGVARGYRNLPERTAAAFVPNPYGPGRLYRSGDRAIRLADGRIRLLGRFDDQVKIRGHRIEPDEVARALRTLAQVSEAVVVPRAVDGDTRLVAYLVSADGTRPTAPTLRETLRPLLPRPLIPDAFVWLDRLPLTPNGKLDSRALPAPIPETTAGRLPTGASEITLAAIFADGLGLDASSAEADFFDIGGTSLLATRLIAGIEDRFGFRLKAQDLFEGASIAALAKRIDGIRPNATQPWRADLSLPGDIRPKVPIAVSNGLPKCLFMTGATGFVGAHLLAEYLAQPGRRAICLTRQGGKDAIAAALSRYDLPARIIQCVDTVTGDLAQPGLGLSPEDRAMITTQAGAVIHAGAHVHHLQPYARLRAANVCGTQEVLRLCSEAMLPLHHVSTLSALSPRDVPICETDAARDLSAPEGGYNQTKWVAEHLVAEAAQRGLPVTIYRLGSVSPHRRSGAFNAPDILTRQVQGYIAAGRAPEGQALINLLPVDYLTAAVLRLAEQASQSGQTYHLIHSAPVISDALFAALAAEGHRVERVAAAQWQTLLSDVARGDPNHPLYPLAALGPAQGFTGDRWPYTCAATRQALSDLPEPPLDIPYLRHAVAAIAARADIKSLPAKDPVS